MKIDVTKTGINIDDQRELLEKTKEYYDKLKKEAMEKTGWVNLPSNFDMKLLKQIKDTAREIQDKCDLLVVVGVGGSFLGAKAVIDALNKSRKDCPDVVFAGNTMSAAYLDRVVRRMRKERTCLCVISKSGTTLESLLAYSILKKEMYDKYGSVEAGLRIYVITDEKEGLLRQEVEENHYESFVVPSDIGGRYSVLSVVGLLPIAAAGHNIDDLIKGARNMAENPEWEKELLRYTIARVALQNQGKTVEIFEYFEANLRYFGEWLKQLFGESEGKEGKGAYPTSLCFSQDLHSIGQFLQQGNQIFYETMIRIKNSNYDFIIPDSAGETFAGKTLEQINECSELGVVEAHQQAGIPISIIEIPMLNEYYLGKMIYFFEMSCALSALNLGVNPFDQPGVEDYKRETKKLVEEL